MCFHYDLGSADLLLEVNFWFATKTGFGLENSFNLDFKNHVYKCENAKQYRPTPEPKSFVKNKKKKQKKRKVRVNSVARTKKRSETRRWRYNAVVMLFLSDVREMEDGGSEKTRPHLQKTGCSPSSRKTIAVV